MTFIKHLNDSGMLNFIAIILSPLVSIFILHKTLRHNEKQISKQLIAQDVVHKESINNQKELNRISVMPYLLLTSDVEIKKEKGDVCFRLEFVNKGNGTALDLMGRELDESQFAVLYHSVRAEYIYTLPFDYGNNVVMINEKCTCEIRQKLKDKDWMVNKNSDRVIINVLFKDMYFNKYEQKFMFLFSEDLSKDQIEIHRVQSYTPQLVD